MAKKKQVETPKVEEYKFTYHAMSARAASWDADWKNYNATCDSELRYCEKYIKEATEKGHYNVKLYLYNKTSKVVVANLREKDYKVKFPSLFRRFLEWIFNDNGDNNTRIYTISWK